MKLSLRSRVARPLLMVIALNEITIPTEIYPGYWMPLPRRLQMARK